MEQLGIQPLLLVAQIINFLVIVLVIKKLLLKPVLSMLEKRKKEIHDSIERADKIKKEEDLASEKTQKILATAKKDARDIIESAKKDAKSQAKEIIEDAQKQAAEIIKKRKLEIDQELELSKKSVQSNAIEIAGLMVEKLLGDVLTTKDQHSLVEKQLKNLSKTN